ncbi:hypothetical protein [Streptomyces sp. URMC 124]|uniref:hypothetical protein n=1 Tax=Streptomyces sp. URMC 124 TaxID=3423405 RepID=UPI003F1CADF1
MSAATPHTAKVIALRPRRQQQDPAANKPVEERRTALYPPADHEPLQDPGEEPDEPAGTPARVPWARIPPPPPCVVTPYRCQWGVTACGQPARLYPCGWRCDLHRPGAKGPPEPAA